MRCRVSMLSIIVKHNAAAAPPEHQSRAEPRRTPTHNENVVASGQFLPPLLRCSTSSLLTSTRLRVKLARVGSGNVLTARLAASERRRQRDCCHARGAGYLVTLSKDVRKSVAPKKQSTKIVPLALETGAHNCIEFALEGGGCDAGQGLNRSVPRGRINGLYGPTPRPGSRCSATRSVHELHSDLCGGPREQPPCERTRETKCCCRSRRSLYSDPLVWHGLARHST